MSTEQKTDTISGDSGTHLFVAGVAGAIDPEPDPYPNERVVMLGRFRVATVHGGAISADDVDGDEAAALIAEGLNRARLMDQCRVRGLRVTIHTPYGSDPHWRAVVGSVEAFGWTEVEALTRAAQDSLGT